MTAPLQQKMTALAKDIVGAVQPHYQDNDLLFLTDREAELWLPLFAVCEKVAPHRVAELEAKARHLADLKSRGESGDWGIQLLGDVRKVFFFEHGHDRPSAKLRARFCNVHSVYPREARGA